MVSCPEQRVQHKSWDRAQAVSSERGGGRAIAPEPQGCPSPLPLEPPASPLLLSYPHHPGMGIQPPLPGQRQSLGALPQEMRPHRKQGTPRTAGLVDPEALSHLPLKTPSNQKCSKCVPRCQLRSAASVKLTEEFSTEPLPFLLALEYPNYPGLVAVLGPSCLF